MKRNALLAIVVLSLLASTFHLLLTQPRSKDKMISAAPRHVSKNVRVAKAPQPVSSQAGLATGASESEAGHRSETIEPNEPTSTDAELPALCNSLAHEPSDVVIELLRRSVRRWAEKDGPAAAAWASQLAQGPTYREALTQVALGWAGSDMSAALDWAQTLRQGDSREAVMLQLGYETARTNPVKALEVAASLEPASQRNNLIEHALSQWAITDSASAVQWANINASDPGLRQRLLAAVAVAMAGQDGSAAATLAATALTPGEEQDRVAVAIVQRWVQKEPELAASWVAQFPDTPAREVTAQNLVAFWAVQDREAARNWAQGLPEGTLRNVGMAAYARVQPATELTPGQ